MWVTRWAGTQTEGFPDPRAVSLAEGRAAPVGWQLWGSSRRLGQATGRAGAVAPPTHVKTQPERSGGAGPSAEMDRGVLVTGPLL